VSSDSPDVITADDVAGLNRTAVTRSAALTRIAGTALIVVGVVALAAAIWVSVRTQQHLDGRYNFDETDSPSFLDRVDAFSQTFSVWSLAGLALAGGVVLRLFADYAVARSGGSITGYEPGDRLPGDDTLDAPQVVITPPEPPTPE
jgi:hypothetical protein